jgi:hypothetical protein
MGCMKSYFNGKFMAINLKKKKKEGKKIQESSQITYYTLWSEKDTSKPCMNIAEGIGEINRGKVAVILANAESITRRMAVLDCLAKKQDSI